MGVKIFTKLLSSGRDNYGNDLKVLQHEMQLWQETKIVSRGGEPLKNVVMAQSHSVSEIIVTVWYDD